MKSSLRSPQLEKAHAQWRPSTGKKRKEKGNVSLPITKICSYWEDFRVHWLRSSTSKTVPTLYPQFNSPSVYKMAVEALDFTSKHKNQFSLVTQLCLTMSCSTPGLPVHHQLLEFTQTLVHWASDAIQTVSSSVVPFSSCPQSFPASGSFPMSQFFASGGQSIGVSASASVLPKNIQDWFPLGWTGWISLQSKGHRILWGKR